MGNDDNNSNKHHQEDDGNDDDDDNGTADRDADTDADASTARSTTMANRQAEQSKDPVLQRQIAVVAHVETVPSGSADSTHWMVTFWPLPWSTLQVVTSLRDTPRDSDWQSQRCQIPGPPGAHVASHTEQPGGANPQRCTLGQGSVVESRPVGKISTRCN